MDEVGRILPLNAWHGMILVHYVRLPILGTTVTIAFGVPMSRS